jgi:hypothetical protein
MKSVHRGPGAIGLFSLIVTLSWQVARAADPTPPTISRMSGAYDSPSPASPTMFCGFASSFAGRTESVVSYTLQEHGIYRRTVLTAFDTRQPFFAMLRGQLTSSLACNSEGLVWVVSYDPLGRTTIWQASASGSVQVLLAPGSTFHIGRRSFVFEYASKLLIMGDNLVVIGSFNGGVQAIQMTGNEYRVVAQYGNENILDACATSGSLFALTSSDLVTGTLRRNEATPGRSRQQALSTIEDVRSPVSYSLGCGHDRGGILVKHDGGLSLVTAEDNFLTSSQVLGNLIGGFPASDIWDLTFAVDGSPVFGMLIADSRGFAQGAIFTVGTTGQTTLLTTPSRPTGIGLIRLDSDLFWYESGAHISEAQ